MSAALLRQILANFCAATLPFDPCLARRGFVDWQTALLGAFGLLGFERFVERDQCTG